MLSFKSDYDFIQVIRSTHLESDGEMGIEVTLNPGAWKESVDEKLNDISNQLLVLLQRDLDEMELRQHNPTLQDAWEQYQTLKRLINQDDINKTQAY